jgi:thiol-disulfide isomerase/thioredoxin
MKHTVLALLGAIALVLTPAPVLAEEAAEPVDFELEQLDGGTLAIADLRGQWVVLNYWATWCAPCRKEIPDLSELHARADHISVVGIAYEETEPEAFREFLAEFSPSYPNLLVDVYNPPQPFGAPMALPTSILLDPAGIPVKTFVGPITGAEIEAFISEAESG